MDVFMIKTLASAALGLLLAAPATAQGGPAFDCAAAQDGTEQAICDNPGLAALDRELAALYAYSLVGPDMDPERQRDLIARQRDWIQGRNGCGQADNPTPCVTAVYGQRILELKTYYAGASGDGGRTSFGPINYVCDAPVYSLSAVFIDGPVAWAVVSWDDNAVMLTEAVAGSGARYTPSVWGEAFEFWMSHDEARLTIPGQGAVSCTQSQG